MTERTNEEWINVLTHPGPERDEAIDELRALLVRGLGYALSKYRNVRPTDVEDFVQEALLKILDNLESFRGASRFTTWAHKISLHAAFTELRRRRWRDVSLDQVTVLPDGALLPRNWVDPSATTEQQAIQNEILHTIGQVIREELTDRQRRAFVAVRLQGMPMEEVAQRMDMTRNALYKLLFDARQKLKRHLLERGLSVEDIVGAFRA